MIVGIDYEAYQEYEADLRQHSIDDTRRRQRDPGDLVLRHSVPIKTLRFPVFLKEFHVELRNSTPRFIWLPERRNENIKYFIPPSGNGTHNSDGL